MEAVMADEFWVPAGGTIAVVVVAIDVVGSVLPLVAAALDAYHCTPDIVVDGTCPLLEERAADPATELARALLLALLNTFGVACSVGVELSGVLRVPEKERVTEGGTEILVSPNVWPPLVVAVMFPDIGVGLDNAVLLAKNRESVVSPGLLIVLDEVVKRAVTFGPGPVLESEASL
jgi:hypothetical protein